MRSLIYKCQPIKFIPLESGLLESEEEYCNGQQDYENLDIAIISTWASWKLPGGRLEAFTKDRLKAFQELLDQAERIIGFNSIILDDPLCQANGINVNTNYDLLREILGEVISLELYTEYKDYFQGKDILAKYPIVAKYTLEALVQMNLGENQLATYESDSVLWQLGEQEKVINNCLHQVWLIKKLYDLHTQDRLFDPVFGRPVSRKFPIPVPTKSIYQKLIAFGLGALFRKDGNYAYLRKFSDYEHYALLCRHISQPNTYPVKDEKC
ncbi:hypothetical protein CDG77_15685 [Nostoc sp. 'Peltigera membranacea cyanobiont' 213]|uniref:hypothetical protein n=1 Tax=Nostoc sp. 'Peltigera membranacea cyanobiont' 213 TaxID=2014530 RepID=UPI000B956196|nr:hypothetical protein [Nostoc sp. 'Peltigera membranacea cyanobiont' 213]OYD91374.1 hypothetical protein CDG77_15685 [Nostoc sp. 'Peltigera membranacea cyanobiont' 213]